MNTDVRNILSTDIIQALQNATSPSASNPFVTMNGPAFYLARIGVSGSSLSNSQVYDDGTNVGIDTVTPTAKLHIVGTTADNTTYALKVQDSLGNNLLNVRDDGFVGVNTLSDTFSIPSVKFSVNGYVSINSVLFYGNSGTFIRGINSWTEGGFSGGDTNSSLIYNEKGSNFYYVNGNTNNASHYFQSVRNGQGVVKTDLFIGNSGYVGIGNNNINPTAFLHVKGNYGYNQLRLDTQYTPTGSADTNGSQGDICFDDSYGYYKTSTGWKRYALSTF